MAAKPRVWFITGISTGIGRALAEAVLARGDMVIGTLRKATQIKEFEALAPGRAIACLLDLNDSARIPQAFEQAYIKAGKVDVVVNNAGYGLMGALEESNDQEIRRQMETNFFGTVNVIRAALPHLREQGGGRIINVSSTAGFHGNPGLSVYTASKHAVTGLSHALAQECAPLNIHVTVVEPSGFRTEWAGASMEWVEKSIPDYDKSIGQIRSGLSTRHGKQSGDPKRAAEAIITLSEMEAPPVYLVLGKPATEYLRRHLDKRREDLENHEALSLSAEFPDGE